MDEGEDSPVGPIPCPGMTDVEMPESDVQMQPVFQFSSDRRNPSLGQASSQDDIRAMLSNPQMFERMFLNMAKRTKGADEDPNFDD